MSEATAPTAESPAARIAAALTPPPFEPSPGALEFVNRGIIRFHFPTASEDDDRVIRVRRPFLGELKTIRLALAEIQDELAVIAASTSAAGQAMKAEATELSRQLGAEEINPEEHVERLKDIRRRDREAAQQMDDARDDRTLDWWADVVFAQLALDEVPDRLEFPAWILDPRLPQQVLNHWRHIPSGPG